VLNCVFNLALLICCIVKNLLYLSLVLNFIFHLEFSEVLYCKTLVLFGACVELRLSFGVANVLHCKKLLYLALVLNLIFHLGNLEVLYCKTPRIFGACVELRLSFGAANVLYCNTPLIFGGCVEIRL